jgi:hypothetical protein
MLVVPWQNQAVPGFAGLAEDAHETPRPGRSALYALWTVDAPQPDCERGMHLAGRHAPTGLDQDPDHAGLVRRPSQTVFTHGAAYPVEAGLVFWADGHERGHSTQPRTFKSWVQILPLPVVGRRTAGGRLCPSGRKH